MQLFEDNGKLYFPCIKHVKYEKENKVEVSTRLSFLSCLGNLTDNEDYRSNEPAPPPPH